jgi:hypothetical protein
MPQAWPLVRCRGQGATAQPAPAKARVRAQQGACSSLVPARTYSITLSARTATRCPGQETGLDDVIVGIVDAGRFGLNSRRRAPGVRPALVDA